MRKRYREYYPPTKTEIRTLWESAFFTFDTNVLLNLYRLSAHKDYLTVFRELRHRIWLPHQVGVEYHRNRLSVIEEVVSVYQRMEEKIEKEKGVWEKLISRHPSVELPRMWETLEKAFTDAGKILQKARQLHPSLEHDDPIRDQLAELFDGKVGEAYPSEKLEELYKKGEGRYEKMVPPGYKDEREKSGNRKYGDFIAWMQVCDEAAQRKQPVILVTDDRKEDWWCRSGGKTIGPRPELTAEIWYIAKVPFHMYQSEQFLQHAGQYLENAKMLHRVQEEAKSLREKQERLRSRIIRRAPPPQADDYWSSGGHLADLMISEQRLSRQIDELTAQCVVLEIRTSEMSDEMGREEQRNELLRLRQALHAAEVERVSVRESLRALRVLRDDKEKEDPARQRRRWQRGNDDAR